MPLLVTRVVAHPTPIALGPEPGPLGPTQAPWEARAVHQSLVLPGSSWGQGALGKCIAFS